MYYNYHSRIKQRIEAGELTGYEYADKYKGIRPVLLLYFSSDPMVRPVREHRFEEYKVILGKHNTI